METIGTIILTLIVAVLPVGVTYWLAGKPKLIVFSPNFTTFQLEPPQEGGAPFTIRAGQVFIQNTGRKSASDVQIVAEPGFQPWGYNIVPSVDHSIRKGAMGEWILDLPFLGPGETIGVQILNGPLIASVRSREGVAKAVQVTHQRVFPPLVRAAIGGLMLVGLVAVAYGLVRLAMLISIGG